MASSDKDSPRLPRNVRLLGLASFLNDVSSEMTFPLIPRFLKEVLGGTAVQLGLIEGLADSTASLLKLWSGGWSDRAGSRKAFVVVGYGLTALVRPFAGLATMPWHLVAVRFTDRFGKGIRGAPRDALVVDSTEKRQLGLAFGYQRAMDHLGAAVGPLLAFAFLFFFPGELRWLFLLTLVPGLLVLWLLATGLREPPQHERKREPFSLSLRPFDGNFRLYLVAMFVFTLGNSSDAFLLQRASELGVADQWLPILWFAFHIVKSAGSLAAGAAVNRLGTRIMILGGWLVYAVTYLCFGLATEAWQVWALFLIYAVYYCVTEPIEKKLVADIVGDKRKGLAFGWFNFAVGIGALPASLLFGTLHEIYGPFAAFSVGAGLALVAAGLMLYVRPHHAEA